MKRKDDLKIDILSSIDEDIIERTSQKRAHLMYGGRRRRQKKVFMISGIAAAACLCLVVTTLLMQLLPLTPPTGEKQVPIYQGMTVSTLSPTEEANAENGASFMTLSASGDILPFALLDSKDNSGNNGNGNSQNAPGHNKPEHNPPAESELAEEIMRDPPEVIGASETLYYALPNQDIYITIHFHNPDDFEILSFTINEKKYSSYMFEAGSDMENLILKVNVGDVEGIIEYTIDAIKYVDGTEIKDVIIDGDKTVKVGVFTEKQPTATVDLCVAGINKIDITLDLSDEMELIGISNGFVKAVLTEGENVVDMQDISLGDDISVTFGGLRSNTKYKYSIVATYDALDGLGFTSYVLTEGEMVTQEYVAFDGVTVEQESISFGYQWNSALTDEQKTIVALELYHGDEKVRDIDVSTTEIDGLLSNNEYRLLARFVNGELDEIISLTFTTKAKAVPDFTLSEVDKTQASFKFGVSITDTDAVGAITKIELLHGGDEPVVADNVDMREFTSLLSNNKYTVRVTYTYDLNDGVGAQTIVKALDVHTVAKAVPDFTLSEVSKTQTSLKFGVDVTDVDMVGAITKIELLHSNDEPVIANTTDLREFISLLSDNDYAVRVTYTYNLNDGVGAQTLVKTLDVKTVAKTVPVINITLTQANSYGMKFDLSLTDPDAIGMVTDIIFKDKDGRVLASGDVNMRSYNELNVRETYTLTVVCDYDLNGGDGVQQVEKTMDVYAAPNMQTPYTVKHYIEELDGSYTLKDTDNLTGEEATEITPAVNSYTGFTAPATQTKLISREGDTLIEYYYTRNSYTVTYVTNGGDEIDTWTGKYEQTIPYPTAVREGYTFGGWFTDVGLTTKADETTVTLPAKNVTVYAWWAEETQPSKLAYTSSSGTVTITGMKGTDTTVVLPSYIDNKTVTAIAARAFKNCTELTSVVVPDSVTSIGNGAFNGCTKLTDITLPFIGESKDGTENTYFGYIFGAYTSGDNSKHVPASLTNVTLTGGTIIDEKAFSGLESLKSINIPNGIDSIGNSAFDGCSGLKSINIPEGVTSIGSWAFKGCTKPTSIVIPNSVTSIGYGAFSGCSGLTSITIPFVGASKYGTENTHFGFIFGAALPSDQNSHILASLKQVTVTGGTVIDERAFYGLAGIASISLPDGITSIGDYAFSGCAGLASINIPESVESIGSYAFEGCVGLTSISLPEGIASIGDYAFSGCSELKSINIPDGVTNIGDRAFKDCSGLTSINIPEGITSINGSTFSGCSGLTGIDIPENVTFIGEGAFGGCTGLTSIIIPDSVTSIGFCAFSGCTGLTDITLPFVSSGTGDSTNFGYIFGASLSNYNSQHVPTSLKNVTITGGTRIANAAFYGCGNIESIRLPDSITHIGINAFNGCSKLTSINIPEGVTTIGDFTFYGCSSLESISLPEGVTSIGLHAFEGCSGLKSIIIPTSVTYIRHTAFEGCSSLESVTFKNPDGWTEGGSTAISGLDDPETAADLLKSTINSWTRS